MHFLRLFLLNRTDCARLFFLAGCLAAGGLQAADGRPPNILFAIADDWGRHAGASGTKWVRTPHFDRVAREGLLFNNAYTPNAKCAPSRACMLTGRNPWQLMMLDIRSSNYHF